MDGVDFSCVDFTFWKTGYVLWWFFSSSRVPDPRRVSAASRAEHGEQQFGNLRSGGNSGAAVRRRPPSRPSIFSVAGIAAREAYGNGVAGKWRRISLKRAGKWYGLGSLEPTTSGTRASR